MSGNSSSACERASIASPVPQRAAGRETDGWPARSQKRHGRLGPVRPGVVDPDARAGHDAAGVGRLAGASRRSGLGRVAQVRAGPRSGSSPNAAPTAPGPLASRSAGESVQPLAGGGCAPRIVLESSATGLRDGPAIGPHQVDAVERLDGPDEHGGGRVRSGRSPR